MDSGFVPILYLKESCPHCFKTRLFLLEAGLADRFEYRVFTPGDERDQAIRDELAPHFDKVTFPTLQFAPGRYMNESNDIIAHYASGEGIDIASLTLFRIFTERLQPRLQLLSRENKALKAELAEIQTAGEGA